MQRLEVSGAVRPIYGSLGVKRVVEWIGPRVGLDVVGKSRAVFPCRNTNLGSPSAKHSHYTDCGTPAHLPSTPFPISCSPIALMLDNILCY